MPNLLIVWEGNLDAQYIHEKSYTLTSYITKYNTKGEKSTHDISFSDIQTNKPLISKLWSFAHRVLNHRECGAFEAAYTLLGLPIHGTDRATTIKWLDVRAVRGRRLKPSKHIENLNPESTDLCYDSFIDDHYPSRPKELETMCLYDFAKWYDVDHNKPSEKNKIKWYRIGEKSFCKKRQNPRLINHWENNPANQPEPYYYALLLLFQP